MVKSVDLSALLSEMDGLRRRNVEVSMLAHNWMARHDWLLSFIQDQPGSLKAMLASPNQQPFPTAVDLPEAVTKYRDRADRLSSALMRLTKDASVAAFTLRAGATGGGVANVLISSIDAAKKTLAKEGEE